MKKYLSALGALFAVFSVFAQSTLNRPNDPVVLTGLQLLTLNVLKPADIVGFKYENATWIQIPIQVDERTLLDIVTPYGALAGNASGYMAPAPSPSNPKIYFYCDESTNVGVDADTLFDSDDELVFMAKDAGGFFDGSTYPNGTVAGSCQQVYINDPLGGEGYVYFFQNDGTLQQNAGVNYVALSSNLLSTSGFPAHAVAGGTNSENTTIGTSKYAWHFASEWVSDSLKVFLGTGVDILDRHKAFFANGSQGCGRHESLFSSGENAFIVAKVGAIRALRSYMGAQSGPLTQRTNIFYEGRQDIINNLRVHNIPSIYDAFDYEPAASGMIYRNSLNTTGVMIDGQQDVLISGVPNWEQVTGAQGTLSMVGRYTTTLTASDATFSNYYDDNSVNPASNCTGTNGAWGTSGYGIVFLSSACSDCYTNATTYRSLELRKSVYIDSANQSVALAASYSDQIDNPLQIQTAACGTLPVEVDSFTVMLSISPEVFGWTTGAGTYASGDEVEVYAEITTTPETSCSFINWTENNTIVSTSQAYQFVIAGNRNLVANFDCPTGISENELLNVHVYPNPTTGKVTIEHEDFTGAYNLKIFDMLGKTLKNAEISASVFSFDIENSGVYQVVISDKNGMAVHKIIVTK